MPGARTSSTLLASISDHGLGHLGQTAPVLSAIFDGAAEGLRLVVRSALSERILRARIDVPFEYRAAPADIGIVMPNAFDVDPEATLEGYRARHRFLDRILDEEAAAVSSAGASLVLANVSYVATAGAARAGVPSIAMCSLNWADLFEHFCGRLPGGDRIAAEILECYGPVRAFLQPLPSMPMERLPRRRPIGPLARLGTDRGAQIRARLNLPPETVLVLVAPGGMALPVDFRRWPRHPGVQWILSVPERGPAPVREDMTDLDALGLAFIDVLASADAVVGKPGYGVFAEATCNGVPVIYALRPDWPEQTCLVEWLESNNRHCRVTTGALARGELGEALETVRRLSPVPRIAPGGVSEAAEIVRSAMPG